VIKGTSILACALGFAAAVWPAGATAVSSGTPPKATLEQCLTAVAQSERAATFAGEMSAVPGTARMEIRIEVLERAPGEASYHLVTAPGLGVWRMSAPGVKVFKYLKQVTNLSAPAFYRGSVRFRWLAAHGRVLASAQLRTRRCEQPLLTADEGTAPAASAG
jgi:hypothetical protein